ncbi:MAG TPA: hypothetical protein VM487_03225 [Phycisphaerae bacterium]|nr:hypothetical protein [Planctomycetota bacterium]HUU94725.1 hypothetical protein [Phycisphaerae bacterium]
MITQADQQKLASELAGATNGARRRLLARYSDLWGISEKTIYQHARKGGWKSGRTPRLDAGGIRIEDLTEHHYEKLAAHLADAKRRLKKPPIAKGILDLETAGIIPAGKMTVANFSRWARKRRVDWRGDWQPRRMRDHHVNLRTEGPNHVHQIDASVYVFWYLRPDGKLACERTEKTQYRNKPGDGLRRVIRWIVCDMCTNAFHVEYTLDETVVSVAEVLYHAWQRKARYDILPFCGVPRSIYFDRHSSHWAKDIQNMLEACEVQVIATNPESPRSHGSVETLHAMWEEWFELDQVLDPPASLGALQARADSMCAYLNARPHRRLAEGCEWGKTRSSAWFHYVEAHPEILRLPVPWEIFKGLVKHADERQVGGDGMISFEGRKYRVPRDIWQAAGGKRVQITISPFRPGEVDVRFEGKIYPCRAIVTDEFGKPADANLIGSGEIKAAPASLREMALRAVRERQAGKLEGAGKYHEFESRIAERFDAITPPMVAPTPDEPERVYNETEARLRVKAPFDDLPSLSDPQKQILRAITGSQSETQIDEAIEKMRNVG